MRAYPPTPQTYTLVSRPCASIDLAWVKVMPSTILNWILNRARGKRSAHEFYGSIVAAARNPALYSSLGVPDTLEGRFEMLTVHMFVFLERLGQAGENNGKTKQELVDLFFADMDVTTRQAGVGDMAVPKRMRELARVFAERMDTYRTAFAATDNDELETALETLVFGKEPQQNKRAERLGAYLKQLQLILQDMPVEELKTAESWAVCALKE